MAAGPWNGPGGRARRRCGLGRSRLRAVDAKCFEVSVDRLRQSRFFKTERFRLFHAKKSLDLRRSVFLDNWVVGKVAQNLRFAPGGNVRRDQNGMKPPPTPGQRLAPDNEFACAHYEREEAFHRVRVRRGRCALRRRRALVVDINCPGNLRRGPVLARFYLLKS